jgi:threonine/homoserine/homoserine lactone efflux protein
MNEYLFLIPISIALLVGVISPGPSFIIVAQTALQKNRTHGIYTSLGLGIGALLITLFSSLGLFLILQSSSWLYTFFKIIGGLYLAYLAYKILINSKASLEENVRIQNGTSYFNSFMIGLITQLSNPKTVIIIGGIIMAFLPQKIPSHTYILLGFIAFVIDAGWYLLVAMILSTKKAQKFYLKFAVYINRFTSFLMISLAIKLVFNL